MGGSRIFAGEMGGGGANAAMPRSQPSNCHLAGGGGGMTDLCGDKQKKRRSLTLITGGGGGAQTFSSAYKTMHIEGSIPICRGRVPFAPPRSANNA